MKTEKMKENRAGYYIPEKYALEILEELKEQQDKFPKGFAEGVNCALSYLSCKDNQEMYRATPAEFITNASYRFETTILDRALKLDGVESLDEAKKISSAVVDLLESCGVEVKDAVLVEVK